MKKVNSILSLTLAVSISFSLLACNTENKDHNHDHSQIEDHKMENSSDMMSDSKSISGVIDTYLRLKNALVKDDSKSAATAGQQLAEATVTLDLTSYSEKEQTELKEILEVIKEHGEHIAKSEIDHQREHFETMTTDMRDLLAITGTDRTLYQQHCPMYGDGGSWLSESSDVKNPLFGSKMLTCGSVKETISK